MTIKPGLRDFLWMTVGAAVLLGFMLLVLHYQQQQNPAAAQVAFQAGRVELVERMRLALASAAEAEKSAVMAITDGDSQMYADQARAATAKVELGRQQLAVLQSTGGTPQEKELLTQFSQAFTEFQRVDKDLLDLAVKNTNVKAYGLAFGPAAAVLKEMDAALARVVTASSADVKIVRMADDARIAALHLLALLPPHIAEENEQKEDEMEAVMAKEDQAARLDLEGLAAIKDLSGNADLTTATARYARFTEIKTQIIKLSRENTNVRSLTISLSQKRKVMIVCQDALAALEQAIQAEPIAGMSTRTPASPR